MNDIIWLDGFLLRFCPIQETSRFLGHVSRPLPWRSATSSMGSIAKVRSILAQKKCSKPSGFLQKRETCIELLAFWPCFWKSGCLVTFNYPTPVFLAAFSSLPSRRERFQLRGLGKCPCGEAWKVWVDRRIEDQVMKLIQVLFTFNIYGQLCLSF